MDISAGTEADIPVIMALERLDGYERWSAGGKRSSTAVEIGNPATQISRRARERRGRRFCHSARCDTPHRCIRLKRIIARNPERGIGSKFLRSVLDICFNELAAHRVELLVHLDNERARRVYARIGFAEEGILRDLHRNDDGSFRSMRLMSILETEWEGRSN